jgi:TPR repeat protein
LAYNYEHGIHGVEVDEAKALELYEEAAKLGNPDAMMKLAWAYSTGRDLGVEEDKEKGLKLYEEAAALGDPDAQWTLASGYEDGDFGEVDKVKALELYTLAAGNDNPDALVRLAKAHSPGGNLGVEVDDAKVTELKAKALEVYRLAAKDGDSYALLRLAQAHLPGGDLGVEADDAKAIELFKEVGNLYGGEVNLDILGVDSPEVMELFKEAICRYAALGKAEFSEENDGKGIRWSTPRT